MKSKLSHAVGHRLTSVHFNGQSDVHLAIALHVGTVTTRCTRPENLRLNSNFITLPFFCTSSPHTKMFPTTKPRRSDSFMEPSNTFTYYEDLYSKRNSDEFDEGPVHNCESESEERPRKKKPFRKSSPDRFFRQFAKPKQRTWSEGLERFGEIKRPSESSCGLDNFTSGFLLQWDLSLGGKT